MDPIPESQTRPPAQTAADRPRRISKLPRLRRGKVARRPKPLRDSICRMIQDGTPIERWQEAEGDMVGTGLKLKSERRKAESGKRKP